MAFHQTEKLRRLLAVLTKRRVMVISIATLFLVLVVVSFKWSNGQYNDFSHDESLKILSSKSVEEWIKPSENTVLLDSFPVSGRILKILKKQPPFAIIVILSQCDNMKERQTIRDTWYKWADAENVRVVFFLGTPSTRDFNLEELSEEIVAHKDIIVDDIQDNYYFLSLKILRILKWFKNTFPETEFRPEFVVKIDQDVFLNLPNLVKHLKSEGVRNGGSDYVGGTVHESGPVIRDETHKWFLSYEEWAEERLPPYVEGPIYVLKGSTAVSVYEAGLKEDKVLMMEDVFITGILAHRRLGIPLTRLGSDERDVILVPITCQFYFFAYKKFQWNPVRGIAFHAADHFLMREFYASCNSRW